STSPTRSLLLISCAGAHRSLHSFPTRRSSDLVGHPSDEVMMCRRLRITYRDLLCESRNDVTPSLHHLAQVSPLRCSGGRDEAVCAPLTVQRSPAGTWRPDGAARRCGGRWGRLLVVV